ncbi:MAG: hypothetical protein ACI8YQ_004446 [Polaribacter sp.]|jgi:hypothetical protein
MLTAKFIIAQDGSAYSGRAFSPTDRNAHCVCAQNGHLIPSKLRNYFERASQNSREIGVRMERWIKPKSTSTQVIKM